MATRWSSHHSACSIRYRSLHISGFVGEGFFQKVYGRPLVAPNGLTIHTFCTVDRTAGRRFAVVARFRKRWEFGDNREVCKAFVCQYAPLRSWCSWGPAEAKRCMPAPRRLHWMASVMVMRSTLSSHSADATFRRPNGFFHLHSHRDSRLQVWSAWKIMKNRVGSTWFEIQAKSPLLGAEKLEGEHELSFRTSRRRFPRTENDDESSIAAYKLQLTPPAGTEALPAGTKGFSSKLFTLASSSLGRFRRMNPRWKAWNPSKATAPFLSCVAKKTNDSAVFKEGTHTFGSISPYPYMQRPDQFVQGRDRGVFAKNVAIDLKCIENHGGKPW